MPGQRHPGKRSMRIQLALSCTAQCTPLDCWDSVPRSESSLARQLQELHLEQDLDALQGGHGGLRQPARHATRNELLQRSPPRCIVQKTASETFPANVTWHVQGCL